MDDYFKQKPSRKQFFITWGLICALVGALIFSGVMVYQNHLLRNTPEKIKEVERLVEKEVEKIKYVKQRGLKTPTVELIAVLNKKIDPKIAEIIAKEVEINSEKKLNVLY